MNQKVSLIIPCYNIESTLNNSFEQTFDSIKNQTFGFDNIEIIIVDDCSTDNTKKILEEYSKKYSNIKIFSTETNTGGPSIPRNIGIRNASADYIMFLDQDDTFNEKMFEILYNEISNNNYDIVQTNLNFWDDKGFHRKELEFNKPLIVKPKTYELKYVSVYIWTGIFRKDFLLKNNIQFINLQGEDFLFMIKCICKTENDIYLIPNYEGINYNIGNNSAISQNFFYKEKLEEYLETAEACISYLLKYGIDKNYINYITTIFKYTGTFVLYQNFDDKVDEEMYVLLKDFLIKNKQFSFVKTNDLSFIHYMFWKFICLIIQFNLKIILNTVFKFMKLMKN